jgi:hypothetical protein
MHQILQRRYFNVMNYFVANESVAASVGNKSGKSLRSFLHWWRNEVVD